MKKFITTISAVCTALYAMYVVDLNLSVIRGEWSYNLLIVLALFLAFDFTLTVSEILEDGKQEKAAYGKTEDEWDSEYFSDPEIEAMWNRSYFYVSRGLDVPRSAISGKEEL